MTSLPLGRLLLSEQFDVMREIARNLVGEPAPIRHASSIAASDTRQDHGSIAGSAGSEAERTTSRQKNALPAMSLAGLRPPPEISLKTGLSRETQIQDFFKSLARGAAPASAAAPVSRAASSSTSAAAEPPKAIKFDKSEEAVKTDMISDSARTDIAAKAKAGAYRSLDPQFPGKLNFTQSRRRPDTTDGIDRTASSPRRLTYESTATTGSANSGRAARTTASGTGFQGHQLSDTTRKSTTAGPSVTVHAKEVGDDAGTADIPDRSSTSASSGVSPTAALSLSHFENALRKVVEGQETAVFNLVSSPQAANLLPERAGIIASFVLNAHMSPAWPPLRPVENSPVASSPKSLPVSGLSANETEIFRYLANFCLSGEQISRIMKLASKSGNRSNLLAAIVTFISIFGTMTREIWSELELIFDDLMAEQDLQANMLGGKRRRMVLR